MRNKGTIVVGVDYSPAGDAALNWAVDAASRRGADLRMVHVREHSRADFRSFGSFDPSLTEQARDEDQRRLDDTVAEARSSQPDIHVTGRLLEGAAAAALVEESETSDLLVIGNLGRGGFVGLLVGSTALRVATHAHCAVVAVPTRSREAAAGRGVVVGVEGSDDRPAILEFAFSEASSLGESVTAVHAWHPQHLLGPGQTMAEAAAEEQAAANEAGKLAEAVAGWAANYPAVELQQRSVPGHPAKVLIDEAAGARLVIVGTRGRGGFRSAALGSVSHALLHHAHRPVGVVPPGA